MRRRKLLIADDSEMNRAILANVLDQEFEVIEATNGQEVIIALQSYGTQISALLLDIVMPEMDGFEVLEEMNRRHWIEDIPTIMISAETSNPTSTVHLNWVHRTISAVPLYPASFAVVSLIQSCCIPKSIS